MTQIASFHALSIPSVHCYDDAIHASLHHDEVTNQVISLVVYMGYVLYPDATHSLVCCKVVQYCIISSCYFKSTSYRGEQPL